MKFGLRFYFIETSALLYCTYKNMLLQEKVPYKIYYILNVNSLKVDGLFGY